MTSQTDEVQAASTELARSLARLVSAVDAVGDDGEACRHISEQLPEALESLAGRLSAGMTF